MRTERRLRGLRRELPVAVPEPARTYGTELRRSGYLRLNPEYPASLIATVQEALPMASDPEYSVAMGGRIKDAVRYIVDPLSRIPVLREFLTPELIDVTRAWYGTEFRVASVRMWRIAHVPAEERAYHHYGNLWHMDGHDVDTLKMFVQISPGATREGSAFRLVSRPDTRAAVRSGYVDPYRISGHARRVLDDRAVVFDGAPGSVIFVDTDRCLHKAGIPEPGETRGMVQFMFRAADSGPEGGDYLANLPPDPNVHEGAIA